MSVQTGITVAIESRPSFVGFINISSSETQSFRETEEVPNENGKIVTRIDVDKTWEHDATLTLLASTSVPEIGTVLTASPGSVKWYITEVGRSFDAGLARKVEVKLKRSEAWSLP